MLGLVRALTSYFSSRLFHFLATFYRSQAQKVKKKTTEKIKFKLGSRFIIGRVGGCRFSQFGQDQPLPRLPMSTPDGRAKIEIQYIPVIMY